MDVDLLQSSGKYVIKKYEDRKMYDLQQSEMVNLNDIEKLVKNQRDLIILDKDDKDITTEILSDSLGKAIRRMKGFSKLSKNKLSDINLFLSTLIKDYL